MQVNHILPKTRNSYGRCVAGSDQVWTIPNDQVVRNVVTAIGNGYRLIDTAARYENEAGVGKGIRVSGI